jgi:predicted RNA polymerase sigma factor
VPAVDTTELATVFREESGRVVATLVRLFGSIHLA